MRRCWTNGSQLIRADGFIVTFVLDGRTDEESTIELNIDEIKRAFRRLAVRYHPDKNPHGEEKFQELSFAYRILSNEDERRLYDASKLRPSEGRDPRMNPDVELEGDALRDFISSLVREEEASAERRKNFASRKQTELDRRRQSFEALVKAEKCRKVYEGDVDKIHQKAQAFDYKSYVEEHKHADLLNDAILSDALREYTKW
eukprot:gene6399-9797_t